MIEPSWTAVLAMATVFLAAATTWMAWDARKARSETARHDREVVFRAALVELATNVQHLRPNRASRGRWSRFRMLDGLSDHREESPRDAVKE